MRKKHDLIFVLAAGLSFLATGAFADWSPAKRLTWNSGYSYSAATAVDSNNHIHVVWHDDTPGNYEIYYKGSMDGGATWSAAKRITWTSGGSTYPHIAIDPNDGIHVVWEDYTPGNWEIYHKRSTDGGATWSAVQRLTWTPTVSSLPSMAIDSNSTVHVVWYDYAPGKSDIFGTKSSDGGATWSPPQQLTLTSGNSQNPAMAIDSSDAVHIVWSDYTPGNSDIYYLGSTAGGATWSAVKRLTWNSGNSFDPAITADSGGRLHVAWRDYTPGNAEIFYRNSPDSGQTWSPVTRLTWNSGNSFFPAIAAESGGAIHVVWEDSHPGNAEIFTKESPDGGTTWNPAKRLTWTSGESCDPALAVDSSGTVHIVWPDDTPGNYEIYYKKGS